MLNNSPNGIHGEHLRSTKRRILMADDHPLVCQGMQSLINVTDDLQVCAIVHEASGLMSNLHLHHPDLLLLDLSMPGIEGLNQIKNVLVEFPAQPILVLSMHDETLYAGRAVHAGARGYVMKSETAQTILAAIRYVLADKVYLSPSIKEQMISRVVANNVTNQEKNGVEMLSEREFQIFHLIGEGLATAEIAHNLKISLKTVYAHRDKIKAKLQVKDGFALTRLALLWRQTNEIDRTQDK